MKHDHINHLEKNIRMYSWFKVFTKRVDLPVITIQLVNHGGVTVAQIALIATITAVLQLILQVPTGYFADRFGNKKAIIIGSLLSMFSPLFYIFRPDFVGGLIASILFFGGYTFYSGAIEAFIHDTLKSLGKENEYSKVMGRAQSFGLVGNIILISLVPATYTINQNLPFVISFFTLLINLYLALKFTYPVAETEKRIKNPFEAVTQIVTIKNIALFAYVGIFAGILNKAPQYRELLYQELGLPISTFGVLLAGGSLLGALMGYYLHVFDKIKAKTFYFFDFTFISLLIIAVGATKNAVMVIISFTLLAAYFRVRMIIIQAKLLENLEHVYKATLLSALNIFTGIGDMLSITLLAGFITQYGYSRGYFNFGAATLFAGIILWFAIHLTSKPKANLNNLK